MSKFTRKIINRNADKFIDIGVKAVVILLGYKVVKDNVLPALGFKPLPVNDSVQQTLDNVMSVAQNTSSVASGVTGSAAQLTGVLAQGVKNVADAGNLLVSPQTWTSLGNKIRDNFYKPKVTTISPSSYVTRVTSSPSASAKSGVTLTPAGQSVVSALRVSDKASKIGTTILNPVRAVVTAGQVAAKSLFK